MANIMDYVHWRGDLSFSNDPFNEIDAAVFCAISYVSYVGRAQEDALTPIPLVDAIDDFFAEGDCDNRIRTKTDLDLLELVANTHRFGQSKMYMYQNRFLPEQETQFGAMTFLLDDGTVFIAFRGTDDTLVGWKEDFNLSFQQSIPTQWLAAQYVHSIAMDRSEPIRIGGHSKGGNAAVFAAARSSPVIQDRIIGVYNLDGPGFTKYMMGDPGYLAIVSRIHTYIPQESIIGMLLEHEEPYTVVYSKSVSIWQHDLYSWEVMGNHMIVMDSITKDSLFLDATIKNWFASMSNQERNQLVDATYTMLRANGSDRAGEIFRLKNLMSYYRLIRQDENLRKLLSSEFFGLIRSARNAYRQMEQGSEDHPKVELKEGRDE